jgi:hypothetical protein
MALKKPSIKTQYSELLDTAGVPLKPSQDTNGPMPIRNIRISDHDWTYLQNHFKHKGLSVSAGIRMVLRDYINQFRQS